MRYNHWRLFQKNILIVSHDPSVRKMLNRAPIDMGLRIMSALDGTEASKITVTTPIDLVLLDLSQPIKRGWDVLEELKAKDPLISVIIIVAKSDGAFRSLGAGAGVLLERPLNLEKLLETVGCLLSETVEAKLDRISGKSAAVRCLTAGQKELL